MATMTLRDVPEDLRTWIKDQADAHHRSINKEVIVLLESLRAGGQPAGDRAGRFDRLMAISRHCAALPVLDSRSAEEILGYDERGLPS